MSLTLAFLQSFSACQTLCSEKVTNNGRIKAAAWEALWTTALGIVGNILLFLGTARQSVTNYFFFCKQVHL